MSKSAYTDNNRFGLALEAAGIGVWDYDPATGNLQWDARCKALFGLSPEAPVSYEGSFLEGLHPEDRERAHQAVRAALERGEDYVIEYRTIGLEDGQERWIAASGKGISVDGITTRFIGTVTDISVRKRAENRLDVVNRFSAAIGAELSLDTIVQMVTDAGVALSGAEFGAFFYNVVDERGETYTLHALSGISRSAFEKFPMPRNTAMFAPTFSGEGVVRSDDILADPRYGLSAPHRGMPKGHLPVRSYLAIPVASRSGEVLGGLFFGHSETARFDAEAEWLVGGVAYHAAVAIDNARLYAKARDVEARLQSLNASLEDRVIEEVEARTAMEIGARATSEQFRLLVDGVVDYAIYMLDLTGHVSTWNPGAERIKGYRAEEVLGRHFSMFYTEEARAANEPQRFLEEARDRGRVAMEGVRLREDGSTFWASVVIDAVRNSEGELVGFAKVTRDISAQREAAQELEIAREALFQAQKMESIGQLTGGIAHDFNNMLAGVIGGLTMLDRRIKAGRYEDAAKYIATTAEAAHRAAALTARLLAFGRRQTLDVRPVDVGGAIVSVVEILKSTLGENVTLMVEAPQNGLVALTDLHQLESAVLNLALNARDAMPGGGRLTIAARCVEIAEHAELAPGPYVKVSVSDTGIGMSDEVLARAFDPFYTTKPSGFGTGLGLSMVYGFAKQVGGDVVLESAPGTGSRVTLYLRATDEKVGESRPRLSETPAGAGEIVLVVEDDDQVRGLIMDLLNDLGYVAKEAPHADAALSLLDTESRLDLLITDVGLPGLNGRQLADIVRSCRKDLPILFLTGYAAPAPNRTQFLEPGMELMVKPFELDQLAAKIKDIIAQARLR